MAIRALIVGGTGGIGYAIARLIAADMSSRVIISGRRQPEDMGKGNMEFRQLDASSMRSIKQYTDAHKAGQQAKLDLLVLTQGVLTTAGRTETGEGIDRKMALHYYGRQLLIRELTPALSDDARVLVVLDGTRGDPAQLRWDDLDLSAHFSIANAAAHCISMTDGMMQAYAKRQAAEGSARRHFVHAYPGIVKTEISASLPWYLRAGSRAISYLVGITPEDCAADMLKGVREAVAAGEKTGTFWSCIDSKGNLVGNKPSWTDDQVREVEEHTWKVVDGAIAGASS